MANIPQAIFHEAHNLLLKSKRVLIVAHQKPDGDTSGSALALWHWLEREGIHAKIFCKTPLPKHFSFLPNTTRAFSSDPIIFQQAWEVIAVCDSGDLGYAGIDTFIKDRAPMPKLINFDHHASNKLFGDVNLVDPSASSTAEVVRRFFLSNAVGLTPEIAKCLLTAVMTDTTAFSNGATIFVN